MKTFIFQKIHNGSTKKLWDRGEESRKKEGEKDTLEQSKVNEAGPER